MMYLYAGNEISKGAKALSERLGIQRIKHKGSKFVGGEDKTVINWGAIEAPYEVLKCNVLNHPNEVECNSNKYMFFQLMKGHCRIPEFTTDMVVAAQWIANGYMVVERHQLRGSGGKGIRIVKHEESLKEAPLYTRYQNKKDEYRIHLSDSVIFDMQRKGLKDGIENPNWRVRNHKNGFIYMREGLKVPKDVKEQAILCFYRTGLDFGAVDVIWNEEEKKAYVLEINTAPGLEGTTIDNYSKLFCND